MIKIKGIAVLLFGSLFAVFRPLSASEYDDVCRVQRVHSPLWQSFALADVRLTDSYFKKAMELNHTYLLSLDADRLIPHVRRGVGLQPKGSNYGGWETNGGCTYGHYLSACAMMYASTGDKELLHRIEYLLSELRECQKQKSDGWFLTGDGEREGYRQLMAGNVWLNRPDESGQPWNYNRNGNSWYGIHKVMAGLRDSYVYAGCRDAVDILLPLADFVADVVLSTNRDLFQSTLSVEQGGMAEVMTDAYAVTGERRYMLAAERFNHINVIYPVANGEDVLYARHANDQIPKFVGAAREYEFSGNEIYCRAASNFWDMVVADHTMVIGGNSCYERFGLPGEESKRLDFTSAETCNTHNMLKLSRQLFMLRGDYKYLNYYERALYNHILASQDPDMPGCVTYYTSLMPGSFKQYSTPFDSFWCCVGTGMENHSKYAESVFFRNNGSLLVNLYIPSCLEWKEKGMRLTMDTRFPESDTISVTIDDAGRFTGSLLFRYPEWVAGEAVVTVNGRPAPAEMHKGSYIRLLTSVHTGDVVRLVLPRRLYIDMAADEPHFGSVMYGPLVLAGSLGSDGMPADRVGDNRTCRDVVPPADIPMLVGAVADLDSWVRCVSQSPLRFVVDNGGRQRNVELIPYFRMHHQRHTVYWKIYSPDEYVCRARSLTDEVKIGDDDDERHHLLDGENDSLYWHDFFWARNRRFRMASDGGWFSYVLRIDRKECKPYNLICRFWGDEQPSRRFDILVDDNYLCTVNLHRRKYLTYVDDIYTIPSAWTKGKDRVKVTFRAAKGFVAGGLYGLKITSDTAYR